MGRKRSKHHNLPPHMHRKGRSYYYVTSTGGKRSGVKDVHFHDIRAKSITDAKRLGGLDYAQALAGHESRDTTEGYIKSKETERVLPLDRKL